jgi:hypothetical protein
MDLGAQTFTLIELDVFQLVGGSVEPITYTFSPKGLVPPLGSGGIPILVSYNTQPARLAISSGLGIRERVGIKLCDFINDGDVAGGVTEAETTFWRVFRARIPALTGRPLRIIEGELDAGVFTPQRTLHYIVRKIEGPQSDGSVTIQAEDLTGTLARGNAQCPVASRVELAEDIDEFATTAQVTNSSDLSSWDASGWLRIGDEAMQYTISGSPGAWYLTFTERGALGTVADEHNFEAGIQPLTYWDDQRLCDIIYDLLVNYAGIPSSQIDFAQWEELDDELLVFRLTTVIWNPTNIESLLSDLLKIFPLTIWYDPVGPTWGFLPFDQIALSQPQAIVITDQNGLSAGSLSIKEDPDVAWTRLFAYHGIRSWEMDTNSIQTYLVARLFINAEAEGPTQRGRAKVRLLTVRWLPQDQRVSVDRIGQALQRQGAKDQRTISMRLPASFGLGIGDSFVLRSEHFVQADGSVADLLLLITSIDRADHSSWVEVECMDMHFDGNYRRWCPDTLPVYDSASQAIKDRYLYLCSDDDTLGTADDPAHTWL